jgi:hypothetical protein
MRPVTAALAHALLVSAFGCGPAEPSGSLTGTWSARGIGHSMSFSLSLTQNGDQISGAACAVDSGVALFRGAPVSGTYPRVQFVVTPDAAGSCCPHLVGSAFAGRQDGTGHIVGRFGTSDLRFVREPRDLCAELARGR